MSAELGTLAFEARRGDRAAFVILLVVAAAIFAFGLFIAVEGEPIALLPAVAVGGVVGLAAVMGRMHRIDVYQNGLSVRQLGSRAALRWDDIEHMQWRVVKKSVNGIPVGTYVWAHLNGPRGKATINLRLAGQLAQDMDGLRSFLTERLGARALQSVQNGQVFSWGKTAHVQLTREGISLKKNLAFGLFYGGRTTVAWTTPLQFAIADGYCSIYDPGAKRTLVTFGCDEPDFYPGFWVFTRMAQSLVGG